MSAYTEQINAVQGTDKHSTDPTSRMFIMGIPNRLSSESLRNEIEKYGDVEVYLCENSADDNGWAFVGFTSREAVERVCRGVKGHQYDSGI
ncbi:hypothetical protein X943_002273 [Babesia divergens]|uniref:RRM domain-containing protein n=1 Tax=Babesia divergens TaxID=32595 RepID=A0AAD9LFP7_BABDI|nr:hypothetical protein X943_002273 [Babesia divergens]